LATQGAETQGEKDNFKIARRIILKRTHQSGSKNSFWGIGMVAWLSILLLLMLIIGLILKSGDTKPSLGDINNLSSREEKSSNLGSYRSRTTSLDSNRPIENSRKDLDIFYSSLNGGNPPRIRLANELGIITTAAAEQVGLAELEKSALQALLNKAMSQNFDGIAQRAHFEGEKREGDHFIDSYSVPASEDRGLGIRSELAAGMIDLLGRKRAEELGNLFNPSLISSGMGKYDVKIDFRSPINDSDQEYVEYSYTDPETGGIAETSEVNARVFKQRFGDSFTKQKQ